MGGVVAQYLDRRFETCARLFTPNCLWLSDETLKADSPFYLVSMPGEVKDPTRGCVTCVFQAVLSSLELDNPLNHSCVNPRMGGLG